jgi:hypothetical protein
MKIVCAEDCGNAPRKEQLRELIIALAKGAVGSTPELMADDTAWDIVGSQRVIGPEAIQATFADMTAGEPTELRIHNIITHGNTAAANFTLTLNDGTQVEYCDVYVFGGSGKRARIKEVRSYRIPLTQ